MVSTYALAALLLNGAVAQAAAFTATATASTPTTMFWTATERLVQSVSTETSTYSTTTRTYRETYYRTVKNGVTPTVTPASSYHSTVTRSNVYMVNEYYSVGAVADSDLVPQTNFYASSASPTALRTISDIYFSMPVVMTAPASCPTAFTVSTTVSVRVPSIVWDQLKPSSTISATTSTGSRYVYDSQTWLLTPSAAPFTTTSDYYYSNYIQSCSTPPSYTGSGRNGGDSRYGGDGSSSTGSRSWTDYEACYFGGCTSLKTWIIIIATILPSLFLLGFFESYFWFRRLMTGKSAMRAGTVCWVLLSLWILCFTRMQDARSKDDQKVLQEKWRATPMGEALKLWMRWGFKHRYPVPVLGQFSKQTVGIVPEGQPLHPALPQPGFPPGAPPPGQMGQVYYYPQQQGWAPPPNGQYPMPPQQAGYYGGEMTKEAPAISTSPVAQPQAPQPAYHPPSSPPPSGPLPTPAQAHPPPANVNEAPNTHPQPPQAPPAP